MAVNMPGVRIERVPQSRLAHVDLSNVAFSSVMSDHMLVAEFRDGEWREGVIRAYGPLPLPPSISALQYGVSVFEGLKAHRLPAGDVALFRPRENARRLNRSAARLAAPPVPEALFLEGLRELVRLDAGWVPPLGRGALYVRASYFSIDESVVVKPADRFLFVIFTFPFGAYYAAPVDVLVTDRYVRAFPGGTGDVKPAGNYAPALLAEREARAAGFQTVLWLDGPTRTCVEECGVMNVFFVIGDEVVTPGLEGTILAGVTRDSVITLLRDMGLSVRERRIPIDEIVAAHDRGTLRECFGTGTGATVSHVRRIRYGDRLLELPPIDARTVGPSARERLLAIATGHAPDRYGWLDIITGAQALHWSWHSNERRTIMKHFLLFYDVVDDFVARRAAFRDSHLEQAWAAADRGELVLAGALAEPGDGAVLLFRGDSPRSAETFAQTDSYVVNGLVTRWRIHEWITVVGDEAAEPVRPNPEVPNPVNTL